MSVSRSIIALVPLIGCLTAQPALAQPLPASSGDEATGARDPAGVPRPEPPPTPAADRRDPRERAAAQAVSLGRHAQAAMSYEALYESTGDPTYLREAGQAWRSVRTDGGRREAESCFRRYLAAAEDEVQRAEARALLARLDGPPPAPPPLPPRYPTPPPSPAGAGHDAAPVDADDGRTPRVSNGFSAKVDVGPALRVLWGHPIGGAAGQLAAGAQFKEWGAVHGNVDMFLGETAEGLFAKTFLAGPGFEFIFGRVRPELMVQLAYIGIDRATRDDEMAAMGGAVGGALTVDLLQSPHANLYLGLTSRLLLTTEVVLPAASLRVGSRFKVP